MLIIEKGCPICSSGAVGFRTCDDGTTVVLMCDECDAVWANPEVITQDTAIFPKAPNYIVFGLDCSISAPYSHWSTPSEVENTGWTKFISGEGRALDE